MVKFDIFSKRQNKKDNEDVYRYDQIPKEFRIQVIHIWNDAIGRYHEPSSYDYHSLPNPNNWIWIEIVKMLCKEYGVFRLSNSEDPYEQCIQFIQTCSDVKVLDIVEITFRAIDKIVRKSPDHERKIAGITQNSDDAIMELNQRFKEHGLGYQFVEGSIIRIDSEFLHQEAVKPIIHLLQDEKFKGAEEEFFTAHEHYLHNRNKEAINESLKALESCLKEICQRKKWTIAPKATSSSLIDTVIKNGLIPQELLAHFTGLRSTLEAGVPTIRNSKSGHGQGEQPTSVPSYLVSYVLNITASALLLLVRAYKENK